VVDPEEAPAGELAVLYPALGVGRQVGRAEDMQGMLGRNPSAKMAVQGS
jgi:hypothetical protein